MAAEDIWQDFTVESKVICYVYILGNQATPGALNWLQTVVKMNT